MAGIADPNVIDLVGKDATGRVLLIIVETRRWNAGETQPSQLKAKINAYAGYILDGSLARHYPETLGQRVDIQLDCPEPPVGEIAVIVTHATAQLEKLGIGFRVNILSERQEPRTPN